MQELQAMSRAKESNKTAQPRYRFIADALLEEIRTGRYAVGTLIPGELDLMTGYDASRHTVREALRVLEDMGMVERRRGRGTVVLSREARPSFVQVVNDPSELFSYPDDSRFRVLHAENLKLNRALARELACQSGSEWTRIAGLRTMADSGSPICWSDVYVVPEYGAITQRLGRSSRPVYELIAETFGETVQRVQVTIYAGQLEDHKAAALGVKAGTASLKLCRRYEGARGRVFEVSVAEHPAGNFSYSFEFTRGWQTANHWSWSQ